MERGDTPPRCPQQFRAPAPPERPGVGQRYHRETRTLGTDLYRSQSYERQERKRRLLMGNEGSVMMTGEEEQQERKSDGVIPAAE